MELSKGRDEDVQIVSGPSARGWPILSPPNGHATRPHVAEIRDARAGRLLAGPRRVKILVASVVLAACVPDGGPVDPSSTGGGKGDGFDDISTLRFNADWSVTQSGPLIKGELMRIHYDPDRLRDCRAQENGEDRWQIMGYFSLDNTVPLDNTIPVTRLEGNGRLIPPSEVAIDALLEVPLGTFGQGHDLGLWFENTDASGCSAWDSNFGANFHFEIEDAPR